METSLMRVIIALGLMLMYLSQPAPSVAAGVVDTPNADSEWSYIAYVGKDGNVWLAPFYADPPGLGQAFPITDDAGEDGDDQPKYRLLPWSPDGRWLPFYRYYSTWTSAGRWDGDVKAQLYFYSAESGTLEPAQGEFPQEELYGSWSLDGEQLAAPLSATLGIFDPRTGKSRLVVDPQWNTAIHRPVWSPDGRWIAFGGGVHSTVQEHFGTYDLKLKTLCDWGDKCGHATWDPHSLGLFCDGVIATGQPGSDRDIHYRSAHTGEIQRVWRVGRLEADLLPEVVLGGNTLSLVRRYFFEESTSRYIDHSSLMLVDLDGSDATSLLTVERPYPYITPAWNSDGRTVAARASGWNMGGDTTIIDAAERRVLAKLEGQYGEWGPSARFIAGYHWHEDGIRLYDLQTMSYFPIPGARHDYAWQPILTTDSPVGVDVCGQWQLSDYISVAQPRVLVREVAGSMEESCQGVYEFENDTSVKFDLHSTVTLLDVGNYSLSLVAYPTGGSACFPLILEELGPYDSDSRAEILTSYLPVQLEAVPSALATTAEVRIEAKTTVESFAWDLALFSLHSLLELAPGADAIPISTETMTKLALRGAYLFDQAAEYALAGDMSAAYTELKTAIGAFGDLIADELTKLGMQMIVTGLLKKLSPADELRIVIDLVAYIANRVYDGFTYGMEPDVITLTYVPAQTTAVTSASGSTSIPSPASIFLEPDSTDLSSSVGWLLGLMEHKEPSRIADLVGPAGTRFVPYGVGADLLGYDNGEEVVDRLTTALTASEPAVLGCEACVECAPDKAAVYYSGIQGLGPSPSSSCEATGFVFFRYDDIWQLVYISCVHQMKYLVSEIVPCSELSHGR